MTPELEAIGFDLTAAYKRFVRHRSRRRARLRVASIVVVAACVFVTAAVASGIGPDLQLDPMQWSILGGGDVEHGKGAYIHAQSRAHGSHSTFMVEHDAGLEPYEAFLLHQRLRAKADATSPVPVAPEPGAICTRAQLTRAEQSALTTLRSKFPAGTRPEVSRAVVMDALLTAFAGDRCTGIEWAGERARFVYAGIEPKTALMPGAR